MGSADGRVLQEQNCTCHSCQYRAASFKFIYFVLEVHFTSIAVLEIIHMRPAEGLLSKNRFNALHSEGKSIFGIKHESVNRSYVLLIVLTTFFQLVLMT